MRRSEVTSADGLKLAAYEAGNSAGPEILFIHGFSQCAECWEPQFYDPQLSGRFVSPRSICADTAPPVSRHRPTATPKTASSPTM
jgi:pimeloyl-ACP methyl ester carboxylesterase